MPRETRAQTAIVRWLRSRGWHAFVVHGEAMQERYLPDVVACVDGRYVGIETKLEGKEPSKGQLYQHRLVREAGGIVIVAHTLSEAKEHLRGLA